MEKPFHARQRPWAPAGIENKTEEGIPFHQSGKSYLQ